jgi:sigma-B regulation protein RsbU (phosphoserine phosphatase)
VTQDSNATAENLPQFTRDTARGYVVLIVDDDMTSRRLLQVILEANGFGVLMAETGKKCLTIAKRHRPDIIVLDIQLPDLNGFAVCGLLKETKDLNDIPIIFVTGLGDSYNVVHGLSIGGSDYVTKPFHAEEVVARIRVHLALRNANRYLIETQRTRLAELKNAHLSMTTDLSMQPEAKCAVYFEPAQEAGGDQYDVVRLSESIHGYFVADIAGHGIEVSLKSAALKASFRENANLLTTAPETLRHINSLMRDFLQDGQHVTAAYLQLNRRTSSLVMASAGHLPLFVQQLDGRMEMLDVEGDVIGVFDNPVFKQRTIPVEPGARFWMFTDGVVEVFSERKSWRVGVAKLKTLIEETRDLELADALSKVSESMFDNHPGDDDRLLLAGEV